MNFDVVVVGSVHTDFVASAGRLPSKGETLPGHRFEVHPGGKGGNQAVAAAQAGAATALIARVGQDLFGRQLREGLNAKGVDTSHVSIDHQLPTGASTVLTGEDGDYASIIVPAAAGNVRAAELDVARDVIANCAVLLLQLEIPCERSAQAAAISRSSRAHRPPVVVLNIAPAREDNLVAAAFDGKVDVLVANAVEAGMLSETHVSDAESATTAADLLRHRMNVDTVIVTLGGAGAVVCHPHGVWFHHAWRVEVVDTIGAGDAFVGALAAELARGLPLDAALPFASAAGALAVTRAGAYDALPAREAILDFLESATQADGDMLPGAITRPA